MDTLLYALFELMAQRSQCTAKQQECYSLRERYLVRVQELTGSDFCDKLRDAMDEYDQVNAEDAFAWGLRLGLAVHRL